MDWSRAKKILIIFFLILNIFLFIKIFEYQILNNNGNSSRQNSIAALKIKGIEINCEIPNFIKPKMVTFKKPILDKEYIAMNLLGNGYSKNNDKGIIKFEKDNKTLTFNTDNDLIYSLSNTNKSLITETLKKFISALKENIDSFMLVSLDNSNVLKYVKKENKQYFFDDKIDVIVTEFGVINIRYNYKKYSYLTQSTDTLSIYQILLMKLQSGTNIKITDVMTGYKEIAIDKEANDLILVPVWYIKLNNKTDQYFNAISGDQIY